MPNNPRGASTAEHYIIQITFCLKERFTRPKNINLEESEMFMPSA